MGIRLTEGGAALFYRIEAYPFGLRSAAMRATSDGGFQLFRPLMDVGDWKLRLLMLAGAYGLAVTFAIASAPLLR